MSYTAADAMRDNGYSDEEVEIALDTDTVEDYLDSKKPADNKE